MSRRPSFIPSVEQIEAEVTEAINGTSRHFDSTVYIEWLCTSGDMREASTAFGQISTDELLMLLAQPETPAQSCKDIGSEIRRRFTDAFLEGITEAALKRAEREDRAEWSDLSPSQRTTVRAAMARAESGAW